jgi:CopG family nickel-responsive transcriptional regulator
MSNIIRFGVSLERELLKKFDKLIKEKKYSNRSEAIRDLIRENLVKREWIEGKEVVSKYLNRYST